MGLDAYRLFIIRFYTFSEGRTLNNVFQGQFILRIDQKNFILDIGKIIIVGKILNVGQFKVIVQGDFKVNPCQE